MSGLLKALLVFGPGLLMIMAMLSFEKALRKEEHSRIYLFFFLFVSALYLSALCLDYFAQEPYYQWVDAIKLPVALSVIPLFFMFLNGIITGNNTGRLRMWLHLALPLAFLLSVPVILVTNSVLGLPHNNSGLVNTWATVGYTFLVLQTMAYTIRIFTRSRVYSKLLQSYYASSANNASNIRYLLISFSAFFLFLDSWLMSFVIPYPVFPFIYSTLVFSAAAFTGWFGLNANAFKKIPVVAEAPVIAAKEELPAEVAGLPSLKVIAARKIEELTIADLADDIDLVPELHNPVKTKKLKLGITSMRKPFDEQKKIELYKRMLSYLVANEVYTDPKLTLKQLANDLGTNTRYLSVVINEFQGRNFNQMLNYYRVKKVMRLLVDNEAQSYSYVGLAQKAGFHSKSVFISAFKSQTGTTPSEFSGTMKKLIQA